MIDCQILFSIMFLQNFVIQLRFNKVVGNFRRWGTNLEPGVFKVCIFLFIRGRKLQLLCLSW